MEECRLQEREEGERTMNFKEEESRWKGVAWAILAL